MKKIILVLLAFGIVLTGCSKDNAEVNSANNDLIETQDIQRLLSASDVKDTNTYEFAVSSDIIEGIDTFKLTDNLTITSNNDVEYTLSYSEDKDFKDKSDEVIKGSYEANPKEGYYKIFSNESLDLSISIM